ncbi:hypothetical protein OAB01_00840 [Bacteroidia bacterium]|nr:hypothetical protein [Bacteroidia bacterium]
MKKKSMFILSFMFIIGLNAQVKFGNWMYDNHRPVNINSTNFNSATGRTINTNALTFQANVINRSQNIAIKTMYNLRPDAFVAVFSLSQEGEDENEVTGLMDARIENIRTGVTKIGKSLSLKTDIISFVPVYEKVLEKKTFAKRTYIEKPVGFELKKNIIILFKESSHMDQIFAICAANQVYDFVRVDFVSTKLSKARAALRKTSDSLLRIQMNRHEGLLDIDMDDYNKSFTEGFRVVYPAEKYLNYSAFGGTSYFLKKYNMKGVRKKLTKHYMPIWDTEFDLVFNPIVDEPVIQVLYNFNYTYTKKPKEIKPIAPQIVEKNVKEFFWITPTGQVRKLQTN